jgi:hypothetical protein
VPTLTIEYNIQYYRHASRRTFRVHLHLSCNHIAVGSTEILNTKVADANVWCMPACMHVCMFAYSRACVLIGK